MKLKLVTIAILLLNGAFAQEKEQPLKNLFNEFHASVNHPLGNGFLGGGLGANRIFRPDKVFSFRTGLDFQFFHVWGNAADPSHYSSTKDVRWAYADLIIPIVMRFNIKYVFIELGGNLGVGIAGQQRATVTDFSNYQSFVVTNTKDSWSSGFSIGPMFGVGTLIPLNEKMDLLIRPDIGASVHFRQEFSNFYARLCIGIHLK
ncbi:MAG: hypothetical protein ACO1N0_21185 [Fluviicola sp.]